MNGDTGTGDLGLSLKERVDIKCFCSGVLTSAPSLSSEVNVQNWDTEDAKTLDLVHFAGATYAALLVTSLVTLIMFV